MHIHVSVCASARIGMHARMSVTMRQCLHICMSAHAWTSESDSVGVCAALLGLACVRACLFTCLHLCV